jgi:hypothetical protein
MRRAGFFEGPEEITNEVDQLFGTRFTLIRTGTLVMNLQQQLAAFEHMSVSGSSADKAKAAVRYLSGHAARPVFEEPVVVEGTTTVSYEVVRDPPEWANPDGDWIAAGHAYAWGSNVVVAQVSHIDQRGSTPVRSEGLLELMKMSVAVEPR